MSASFSLRNLSVVTTVAVALAAAGAVSADSDDDDDALRPQTLQMMPGYGLYGRGMAPYAMMGAVDRNGDGIVTSSEASQHASLGFALFDTDDDGELAENEYLDRIPAMMPMGRRNTERMFANRAARFKAMDRDDDGTVTLAEFMSQMQARFEAADTDGDGTVTVWEFRAQRRSF